jgi:hypothetical protein
MTKTKEGFLLYKAFYEPIKHLSNEDKGKLLDALFKYQIEGSEDTQSSIYPFFLFFKNQFKRDDEKSKRGEHHWNWKNGRTNKNSAIRNSTEMKHWRIEVFSRDKYTCQKCFKKGGTLHAHHVKKFADFPNLRFAVSNGLTLCVNCHRNIHSKNSKKNDKFTN